MNRRVIAALLLSAVAAMVAPAPALEAFGDAGRGAYADWLVFSKTNKRKATLYVVAGWQGAAFYGAEEPATGTVGAVGRIPCSVARGKHIVSISCYGDIGVHELALADFDVHPLLQSAHVTIDTGRYTHTATWTSDDEPDVDWWVDPGTYFSGAGAEAYAYSRAAARLYDKTMKWSSSWSFGYVWEGVFGVAYDDSGTLSLDRDADTLSVVRELQGPA